MKYDCQGSHQKQHMNPSENIFCLKTLTLFIEHISLCGVITLVHIFSGAMHLPLRNSHSALRA